MAEMEHRQYRFGVFEVDSRSGELRRKGVWVKIHAQPFQVLCLMLERPGEVLSREEISRALWPEGTFVDYEHGVNSAVNRLREALGDRASRPRFVETLARRGYRFVAPVETIGADPVKQILPHPSGQERPAGDPGRDAQDDKSRGEVGGVETAGFLDGLLATESDLPKSSHAVVQTLFVLLQLMYVGFYVGALSNLAEINDLMSPLAYASETYTVMIVTAAVLIPVRVFLVCAALFYAPGLREKFLKLWWMLLPMDVLWALAPFLLLHHMNAGLALACMTPLVYSPFAQRSLVLMGAGRRAA